MMYQGTRLIHDIVPIEQYSIANVNIPYTFLQSSGYQKNNKKGLTGFSAEGGKW
jgi:hypothetical protein